MAGQQVDVQKLIEKLEQLPPMGRLGIYAIASVAVVGLYWLTLHGGVQNQLVAAQNQLAQLQGEVAEARAVAANLDSFRKRGEELREELRAALERLPNAAELPVLLTDISSLGKKSGLEFRAFKPKGEVMRDFYAEVPIDIEFIGKFHEAGVFFDRLSRLSRIVNMTELEMSVSNDDDAHPDLKVKGVATTFRFLDKKAASAPGQKGARGGKGA